MRIPGQRHRAHCSTAPADSQRLLPEPQQPPNFPAGGNCPGVLRQHASICPFGPSNNSQFPFCGSSGGRTGCSASTPTASTLPTHTSASSRTRHPQAQPPRSAPPQLHCIRKVPEAGRQQPLAAQQLGFRVPARPPADLRMSGQLWGAMIYYTAVQASGASSAPAATAGGPGPRPRPPMPPQTQTPGPWFLPILNPTG